MATPAVQQFHNDNMRQERERVLLRIANGTKASSPQIISFRQSHPTYKGLPDNSLGSKTMPFFASKDESQCPLEDKLRMRGGVLHTKAGKEYGYEILKRRARDDINQRAAAEGLPPTPARPELLTEEESKSLELDQLLNAIDDAADSGSFTGQDFTLELKNISRLAIALTPSLSDDRITDLINYIGGDNMLLEKLNQYIAANGRNGPALMAGEELRGRRASIVRVFNAMAALLNYLMTIQNGRAAGYGEADMRSLIKAAAKKWFGMSRNMFNSIKFEIPAPANRVEMAGAFAGQNDGSENDFLSMAGVPSSRATTMFDDDEEAGERKEVEDEDDDEEDEDDDDDEAPGGAAAGPAAAAPKRWGAYRIGARDYNMTTEPSYLSFRALREAATAQERKNIDAMTRGRLQAGLSKNAAMEYTLERYAEE